MRHRFLILAILAAFSLRKPAALAQTSPAWLDHVVLGISDLEQGVRSFEQASGVRPIAGGEHPGAGTHNALASAGGRAYLEILAPVPDEDLHEGWKELADLDQLTPLIWAVGVSNVDLARKTLEEAGFATTIPTAGSRTTKDGATLAWKTSLIQAPAMAVAPFLIEWQEGVEHPAMTAPGGCELTALELKTTSPAALARLLKAVQIEASVEVSDDPGFALMLDCPNGEIVPGN